MYPLRSETPDPDPVLLRQLETVRILLDDYTIKLQKLEDEYDIKRTELEKNRNAVQVRVDEIRRKIASTREWKDSPLEKVLSKFEVQEYPLNFEHQPVIEFTRLFLNIRSLPLSQQYSISTQLHHLFPHRDEIVYKVAMDGETRKRRATVRCLFLKTHLSFSEEDVDVLKEFMVQIDHVTEGQYTFPKRKITQYPE